MSASGLIYAAIALMWAAVLIPMWLRNHDTASENRSVERFGQAMRVLSRREQAALDARRRAEQVTTPVQPRDEAAPVRPARTETRRSRPSTRDRRPARPPRTLAQRRARTLGVLAGLTLLLTLAVPISPLPWWAPLPVLALLVAFVVHLRVQAIQKQRRRAPGARRRPQRPDAHPAAEEAAAQPAPAHATDEHSESGFVSGPSRAVTVETKGRTSAQGVTFEEPATEGEDAWNPNPLPLPTYVTAPKAVRPIKVIDLTTPGAWSSGRLLDDGLGEEDLLAAEVASDELDALLEHEAVPPPRAEETSGESGRRAVGD